MQQILLFSLLGLGSGALIAGIALGVVLTYRGSGIINLATGGMAMLAGYAFWALRVHLLHWSTAPALQCGKYPDAPGICNDRTQFFLYKGKHAFVKTAGWLQPPS